MTSGIKINVAGFSKKGQYLETLSIICRPHTGHFIFLKGDHIILQYQDLITRYCTYCTLEFMVIFIHIVDFIEIYNV